MSNRPVWDEQDYDELQARQPAPARGRGRQRGGDLEIIEERVLVAIPRGDREELRVTFTRAKTGAAKETAWHALRVWYRADDGSMRPGKAGCTVRGKEIHAVTIALLRACASAIPPQDREAAKAVVAALGRGRT